MIRSIRNRLVRVFVKLMLKPVRTEELIRLGTPYGGWWVPSRVVYPGSIAYLVGAGEDISLDLELHARGCVTRTFDPTPRAVAHVNSHAPESERFRFRAVGLWNEDTSLKFYSPQNVKDVSHSVLNLQRTQDFFEADVRTLRTLVRDENDSHIDLLKMDVEGAEHVVVQDILANGPFPDAICLEFDQPCTIRQMKQTARMLAESGYRLQHIEGWDCTFVR